MEQKKQFILVGTEAPSEQENWLLRIMNQLLEQDADGVLVAFTNEDEETHGFACYEFSIRNFLDVSRSLEATAKKMYEKEVEKRHRKESKKYWDKIDREIAGLPEDLDSIAEYFDGY